MCSPILGQRVLEFSGVCSEPKPWTAESWSFPAPIMMPAGWATWIMQLNWDVII